MLEKRHTRISTDLTSLATISSSHPFTQQVDVVFPSRYDNLENVLSALSTRYAKGKVDLAKVYAVGPSFVHPYTPSLHEDNKSGNLSQTQSNSDILALSVNRVHDAQNDDVWCIDTRGILSLCVCKESYEKLGLTGQKLSFKHQRGERYVISLPIHGNAESAPVQDRRRSALESWDRDFALNVAPGGTTMRGPSSARSVEGVWEVVYCSTAPVDVNLSDSLDRWTNQVPVLNPIVQNVTCEISSLEDVWIPNPVSISPRPSPKQKEEYEDWENDVSALFEWVGMAGFHAQRLQINDRVDPFVANYEPPSGSRVGNLTHLRWRGLLSPTFVQSIIDTLVTFLESSQSPPESFVAITVHGITNSPVVYLPQNPTEKSKNGSTTATISRPPAHLPSKVGEDTWCLLLTSPEEGRQNVKSVLYGSVGQWDARWG